MGLKYSKDNVSKRGTSVDSWQRVKPQKNLSSFPLRTYIGTNNSKKGKMIGTDRLLDINTDNAANNKTLYESLSDHLRTSKGVSWLAKQSYLPLFQ